MGPKRRTPFKPTSDAARKRQARMEETSDARERRLSAVASRQAASRAAETPDVRDERLEEMRTRASASRAAETPDVRDERLEAVRTRASTSRAAETSDVRDERLEKMRTRASTSRAAETPDVRDKRLEDVRTRASTSRAAEMPVERDERLAEMRTRTSTSREAQTPAERDERLSEMRTRESASRLVESPDEREVRLEGRRTRASTSIAVETLATKEVRQEAERSRQRTSRARPWQVIHSAAFNYDPAIEYEDHVIVNIGAMDKVCEKCGAKKWKGETKGMCCRNGKVQLPALEVPPEPLKSLLLRAHPKYQHFISNIRKYNSCFQMTSFGADKIDRETYMYGKFKIQGQVYHEIGSLLPPPTTEHKFLQIYFMGNSRDQARQRQSNMPDVLLDIVLQLQEMMHEHNTYVKEFKAALEHMTRDEFKVVIRADRTPAGEHERRFNAPTVEEVAILIVGNEFNARDIVVHKRTPADTCPVTRISETNRAYDPLQYPLLFPCGEDGYQFEKIAGHKVTAMQFYSFRMMMRDNDFNLLLRSSQLFHQYVVDMYAKIESERLLFFKLNQTKLRVENYDHLRDAMANDGDPNNIGRMTILPSTFTGGPRYMQERTQDAMTYVRNYGTPDLFITFTCNPNWTEIIRELLPGQKPEDRTDLEARVFKQKLNILMNLLNKGQVFGKVRCYMYSIEWQKRGLPHAHILLWLEEKIRPNQIDLCISAELPSTEDDPVLYEIVSKHMLHGPCGNLNRNCPCMVDGKCSKRYPRDFVQETQTGDDGYPVYRRRSPEDGGFTVTKGAVTYNNRWVVPYCPLLSRIFNAHINVEYCNSVKAIKYICKYVNKGSDQAVFQVQKGGAPIDKNDEVKLYQYGRYISSNEAVWRILEFPIHERYPTVTHLAVHLENGQRVYFSADNVAERATTPPATTLTAFFQLCNSDDFARGLFYCELPRYYTWQPNKTWQRRKRGGAVEGYPGIFSDSALGRVYTVHPNNSECFYLRLLLHNIRGPSSFTQLRTVDDSICATFHEACLKLGLLENDEHWNLTLQEATMSDSSHKLRNLFAIILTTCSPSNPLQLWETHKKGFAEDILHRARCENPALELDYTDHMFNQALILIEDNVLSMVGKTLQQLHLGLPSPVRGDANRLSREMLKEMAYDTDQLALQVETDVPNLSPDQTIAYNRIVERVEQDAGGIIFLDAPGGTGKTFLLNLLLAKVRSQSQIAIAVASSGIAATLLSGGRTAHSTLKLPLDLHRAENPVCNISKGTGLAQVLLNSKLMVWDECPMSHKAAFEALDRSLRDIRGNTEEYMGGVTVVLAGDFRQTLPIIPRGTPADEINACLRKSYLWENIEKVSLTTNQRVRLMGDLDAGRFSKFLLDMGNGNLPLDANGQITFPKDFNVVKTAEELLSKVLPDLTNMFNNSTGDHWQNWLAERAVLAPRNDLVDKINNFVLTSQMPGQEIAYKSLDTVIDPNNAVLYPTEFLNSLQISGVPTHNLVLKVGAPIMLLRNLDPPKLCNGTRLCVKKLLPHVIEARIMTGCGKLEDVFIPRIPIIPTNLPYEFKRLQFPVRLSFAMSINKAQGQSLKVAGVDLSTPCFSHGQLYVACSRVGTSKNLFLLAPDGKTTNVVYPQALR